MFKKKKSISDEIDDLKYFIRFAEDSGLNAQEERERLQYLKDLKKAEKRSKKK